MELTNVPDKRRSIFIAFKRAIAKLLHEDTVEIES